MTLSRQSSQLQLQLLGAYPERPNYTLALELSRNKGKVGDVIAGVVAIDPPYMDFKWDLVTSTGEYLEVQGDTVTLLKPGVGKVKAVLREPSPGTESNEVSVTIEELPPEPYEIKIELEEASNEFAVGNTIKPIITTVPHQANFEAVFVDVSKNGTLTVVADGVTAKAAGVGQFQVKSKALPETLSNVLEVKILAGHVTDVDITLTDLPEGQDTPKVGDVFTANVVTTPPGWSSTMELQDGSAGTLDGDMVTATEAGAIDIEVTADGFSKIITIPVDEA